MPSGDKARTYRSGPEPGSDEERVADLRLKIARLESLACDSVTTEAESTCAQEVANKLRIELAGLLRKLQAADRARSPSTSGTRAAHRSSAPPHGDPSPAPSTLAPAAPGAQTLVLRLACGALAIVVLVLTKGALLWLLPGIAVYYLVAPAQPRPAPTTPPGSNPANPASGEGRSRGRL